MSEYRKKYRKENKEKLDRQIKQWFLDNKEENRLYRKKQNAKWNKENIEKIKEYGREYRTTHLKERREYESVRRKTDPLFKLTKNLRSRLRLALKAKSWHKNTHFNKYIGCTLFELKLHIERKFTVGMSWNNYGEWHIDHIVSLSSANSKAQLYEFCHYTNLQPLWAADNLRKSNKGEHQWVIMSRKSRKLN